MTNGFKHLKALFRASHGPFRALGLGLLLASFPLFALAVASGAASADSGIPLSKGLETQQDRSDPSEIEIPSPEQMEALAELVSPSLSSYFVRTTRILSNRPVLELLHLDVAYDLALLATEIDSNNIDVYDRHGVGNNDAELFGDHNSVLLCNNISNCD